MARQWLIEAEYHDILYLGFYNLHMIDGLQLELCDIWLVAIFVD